MGAAPVRSLLMISFCLWADNTIHVQQSRSLWRPGFGPDSKRRRSSSWASVTNSVPSHVNIIHVLVLLTKGDGDSRNPLGNLQKCCKIEGLAQREGESRVQYYILIGCCLCVGGCLIFDWWVRVGLVLRQCGPTWEHVIAGEHIFSACAYMSAVPPTRIFCFTPLSWICIHCFSIILFCNKRERIKILKVTGVK